MHASEAFSSQQQAQATLDEINNTLVYNIKPKLSYEP